MILAPIDWLIFFSVPALAWAISLLKRDRKDLGSWRGYFLANATVGSSGSAIVYFGANIAFTGIFLILTEEAYNGGFWVLCVPVFWLLGTIFLRLLYPKMRRYVEEGKTLHQTLGELYNSPGIQQWASLWTIIAFVGTIGLEFYGGIRLLQWANLPFLRVVALAMMLAFIVGAFTATGGFRGVVLADVMLDIFALTGTLVLFIWLIMAMHGNPHPAALAAPTPVATPDDNISFVVGMAIIFIPFQFCTLDSWQRFAAYRNNRKSVTKWLIPGGLLLSLVYCVPILIGVAMRSWRIHIAADSHPLNAFLLLEHLPSPLIGVVFAGFLAAIFSTADELLNCCALSLLFDALRIPRSEAELNPCQRRKLVLSGQFYTGLFALISALVALFAIHYGRSISDLAVAVFSGQVLFTVPLLIGFFRPQHARRLSKTAKWSMILGFVTIVTSVMIGWMINDSAIADAAPICGLFVTLLCFLPGSIKYKIWSRQT